jgi:hypothetical protein
MIDKDNRLVPAELKREVNYRERQIGYYLAWINSEIGREENRWVRLQFLAQKILISPSETNYPDYPPETNGPDSRADLRLVIGTPLYVAVV